MRPHDEERDYTCVELTRVASEGKTRREEQVVINPFGRLRMGKFSHGPQGN
jgi:hypothetical protein